MTLPSRHPLTRLLILDAHEKYAQFAHSGILYTLMLTRRRFWVIKELSRVRYYIKKCNSCVPTKAHSIRQLMTDLLTSRMTIHKKLFANTDCDYMGPFTFKRCKSERKAWGLLFTCIATRAIHVELVISLNLSVFIMAFSRFIDLKGPVSSFSDNGTIFKAIIQVFRQLLQFDELRAFFRKKKLTWEFISSYSPS